MTARPRAGTCHAVSGTSQDVGVGGHRRATGRPSPQAWAGGLLGAAGLLALYLGIVSLAESWAHAVDLLRQDLLFVFPMVAAFGVQSGLLAHLRWGLRVGSSGAVAGASGGTSAVAMAACCAHHVADLVPLLGISAAATLLAELKAPLLVVSLASNLVGIVLLWRRLREVRRGYAASTAAARAPAARAPVEGA